MREQKLAPEYSKQARKYISGLDKKAKLRLKESIEKIPEGDIRPYKAISGYFRLRVGDLRIVFEWLSHEQILIAIIDSRGQAYKKGV